MMEADKLHEEKPNPEELENPAKENVIAGWLYYFAKENKLTSNLYGYFQKGLKKAQQTGIYKFTNNYLRFEEKIEFMTRFAAKGIDKLESCFFKFKDYIIVVNEKGKNYISVYCEIVKDDISELKEYLQGNFKSISKITKDTWLRLDFNKDGSVSVKDFLQTLKSIVKVLKEFEYVKNIKSVASNFYNKVIDYVSLEKQLEEEKEKDTIEIRREVLEELIRKSKILDDLNDELAQKEEEERIKESEDQEHSEYSHQE